MPDAFREIFDQSRAWAAQVAEAGWLSETDLAAIKSVEQRRPDDLFSHSAARPLVVALFGGTGVGKSTLLNRLAGGDIARTGVLRPTSREVTLYVHEKVALAALPPHLPLEHVKIVRHDAPAQEDVAWLDAPDIDSTEVANRELALAWLPHVDLVIYVVSPERYRDDAGWQVLRARGARHGWIFALNRWDEGDEQQRQDFAGMLSRAGFEDALLYCTASPPGRGPAGNGAPDGKQDDFSRLVATVQALVKQHAVLELSRLGHRARLTDLQTALRGLLARLGEAQVWGALKDAWNAHWAGVSRRLSEGMSLTAATVAARLAVRNSGWIAELTRQFRNAAPADDVAQAITTVRDVADIEQPLWDAWCSEKLERALDEIELRARQAHLAAEHVRARIGGRLESIAADVTSQTQDALRAALANPITPLRRVGRRATGFLMSFLPAVALLWVAFTAVTGYYRASVGGGDFLGVPFAVNSALLVLVCWVIPFWIDRRLQPSLELVARRVLNEAAAKSLADASDRVLDEIDACAQEAREFRAAADAIIAEIDEAVAAPLEPTGDVRRTLQSSGAIA